MSNANYDSLFRLLTYQSESLLALLKDLHPERSDEIQKLYAKHLSQLILKDQELLQFSQSDKELSALIGKLGA